MHSLLFAARRGAFLALAMVLTLALGACSGGDADGSAAASGDDNTGGGTIAVTDGVAEISADDLEFDASTIEAPAGEAFTVRFTNAEDVPHNFSVYTEEGGELIVQGEIITGPDATTDVAVPSLDAGEYFFVCDVHPEMTGTIVVGG
jgi:plastocyanin